jgi:hypothetical protein
MGVNIVTQKIMGWAHARTMMRACHQFVKELLYLIGALTLGAMLMVLYAPAWTMLQHQVGSPTQTQVR